MREANRDFYAGYRQRVRALFLTVTGAEGVVEPAATGLITLRDRLWLEILIGAIQADPDEADTLGHDFIEQQLSPNKS